MEDAIVPVALFVMIGVLGGLASYYKFRSRQEVQNTVREAITKGDHSPEMMDQILLILNPPNADFRRGIIGMGLGVALAVFAIAIPEPEALRPMLGISGVAFVMGLAYLYLSKQLDARNREQRS